MSKPEHGIIYYQAKSSELEDANVRLQREINRLNIELAGERLALAEIKVQRDGLQAELEAVTKERDQAIVSRSKEIGRLREELEDADDTYKFDRAENKALRRQVKYLERQVTAGKRMVDERNRELNVKCAELASMTQHRNEMRESFEKTFQDAGDLTAELATANALIHDLDRLAESPERELLAKYQKALADIKAEAGSHTVELNSPHRHTGMALIWDIATAALARRGLV